MDLQPTTIEDDLIRLLPLSPDDFDRLYRVASDPLVWEQHPSRDRYKQDVFTNFFREAMESKGAFIVVDKQTGQPAGSSRFYNYDPQGSSIEIGYTFLARKYWGKLYNSTLKTQMLNHAFRYVDNVVFHIGSNNIRSQKAIEKLGAVKFGEELMAYAGEQTQNLNYAYKITKEMWTGK